MEKKLKKGIRVFAIVVLLLNVWFLVYSRLGFLGVIGWGRTEPAVLDEPRVTTTPAPEIVRIFIRNSSREWHTIEFPRELGAPFGGQKFSFRGNEVYRKAKVGERFSIIVGNLPYDVFEILEVLPEGIWVKPLGEIELYILPPKVPVEPQKSAALGYFPAQSGFFLHPLIIEFWGWKSISRKAKAPPIRRDEAATIVRANGAYKAKQSTAGSARGNLLTPGGPMR